MHTVKEKKYNYRSSWVFRAALVSLPVFLPRNSKNLYTEHYIPVTNPSSSETLAVSQSPSLPLCHHGHHRSQTLCLVHSSGTKLRRPLLCSVVRCVAGNAAP